MLQAVEAVVDLFAGRQIAGQVDKYVFGLRGGGRTAAAQEYLEKWGHLLPRDVAGKGAGYIAPILDRFLKQHPRLSQGMRGIH